MANSGVAPKTPRTNSGAKKFSMAAKLQRNCGKLIEKLKSLQFCNTLISLMNFLLIYLIILDWESEFFGAIYILLRLCWQKSADSNPRQIQPVLLQYGVDKAAEGSVWLLQSEFKGIRYVTLLIIRGHQIKLNHSASNSEFR